jgi:hypothetical protein
MTNQKIPPCPVCGVVPTEQLDHIGIRAIYCWCMVDILGREGRCSWQTWEAACNEYLGRALRAHDIETVAQVDALVARTSFRKDVPPHPLMQDENGNLRGHGWSESIKEGEKC